MLEARGEKRVAYALCLSTEGEKILYRDDSAGFRDL
jgi:hypothetical protein